MSEAPRGAPHEPSRMTWRRRFTIAALPLGALALVILLIISASGPRRRPVEESQTPVRYVTAQQGRVVPRSIGFGTVVPATEWRAVAEVSGRVVYRHPNLRPGSLLEKGTQIIRLDPTDYDLAVKRLEANIRASEAALAQLAQEEKNTAQSLEIEERALTLSQRDLERQQELRGRGTVSQAAVDAQERAVLTQRQSVQSLRNQLSVFPVQRTQREAELDLAKVQLAEAQRDLDRTKITLPLDARIQSVSADPDQVITQGQVMVEADGIDVAEITAQLPLVRIVPLIPVDPAAPITLTDLFGRGELVAPIIRQLEWSARVRLNIARAEAVWEARVVRLAESLDPETRTAGVVVAVDDPIGSLKPGERPILSRNSYVAVELIGTPRPNTLAVPVAGLHGSRLYVITGDDRLEIRTVDVAFRQGSMAVLTGGVTAGERVVISDLIPAVPGMKLKPQEDADATARLAEAMAGTEALR